MQIILLLNNIILFLQKFKFTKMADNHNVRIEGSVEVHGKNGKSINFVPDKAEVVVPHASNTFKEGLLFVGVGGDVYARPAGQTTYVLFKNVPDGSILPVYIIAVSNDASTTATDMLILY